ncbi:MAG: MFS transporter [Acidimicrobiales bacterium]
MRWFPTGLTVPVLVLLLTRRGLSLGSVGAVLALYGVTAAGLEVPTGGLADTVGRRPVLVASGVLSALGTLGLAVASGGAEIATALVVLGAARALDSGPLQAWFVDAVQAVDPEADLKPGLSRAGAASAAALGGGSLAGGWLASVAPGGSAGGGRLVDLSLPFLVAAGLTVLYGVAVALLVHDAPAGHPGAAAAAGGVAGGTDVEGPTGRDLVAHSAAGGVVGGTTGLGPTMAAALRLTWGRGELRRVLAVGAGLGLALAGIELLAPPAFARLLGGPSAAAGPYAALVTAGFGATAVGSALVPAAARAARTSQRALRASLLAAGLAALGVGIGRTAPAAVAFVAFYLAVGAVTPLLDEATHRAVAASERATVLSVRSSAFQVGGLTASLGVGALASAAGTAAGLAALAVGAVLAAVVAP